MNHYAIETQRLSKTFPRGVKAVSEVDLQVRRGAVYGLMGRNGAGKTTTLRLLLGLLRADSGSARVLGEDLWNAPRSVRARVAYVSQTQQLHGWMSLEELCRYAAHFYEQWDLDYARELARRWELNWKQQVGRMSGGEQRKTAILLAFASRPEVMVLDEPAAGLDPIARRQLVDEIVDVLTRSEGYTILFSTHIISDLERIAEYVGMMERGRLVSSARLEEFQQHTRRVQVIFGNDGPPSGFVIPGAVRSQTAGPVVTAVTRLTSEIQLEPIRHLPGVRVNVFPLGLEEIFLELSEHGVGAENGQTVFPPNQQL